MRGMERAYKLTHQMVDSDWYFLIDADCELLRTFHPERISAPASNVDLVVWQSKNPVNGLVYGYGGPKLASRKAMSQLDPLDAIDVLAGLSHVVFKDEVACITRFNRTPFQAWKAGFRECCVLTLGSEYGDTDGFTESRIDAWTTRGADAEHGIWAIKGAHDGIAFANRYRGNDAAIRLINDPTILLRHFERQYGVEMRNSRTYPGSDLAL